MQGLITIVVKLPGELSSNQYFYTIQLEKIEEDERYLPVNNN